MKSAPDMPAGVVRGFERMLKSAPDMQAGVVTGFERIFSFKGGHNNNL